TSSLDHLSRADLAGLAQLDRAIHLHRTAGDELLAGAAAVDHAAQLQQLVEFDVVALELEFDLVHRDHPCSSRNVADGGASSTRRVANSPASSVTSTPTLPPTTASIQFARQGRSKTCTATTPDSTAAAIAATSPDSRPMAANSDTCAM